ncbi:MAG: tail fiber protein [Bacteroidota bacterium]
MEGYIGQIMLFGATWAPRQWALCHGQLLPIASNQALFSIIGTIYGGDGRTTFGLPDLRGRVPLGSGNGPGLTDHRIGARGGAETNVLSLAQLPAHAHGLASGSVTIPISEEDANQGEGAGNYLANGTFYHNSPDAEYGNGAITLDGNTLPVGQNQAINNQPPFLAMNYIICLQGVFPSRN